MAKLEADQTKKKTTVFFNAENSASSLRLPPPTSSNKTTPQQRNNATTQHSIMSSHAWSNSPRIIEARRQCRARITARKIEAVARIRRLGRLKHLHEIRLEGHASMRRFNRARNQRSIGLLFHSCSYRGRRQPFIQLPWMVRMAVCKYV